MLGTVKEMIQFDLSGWNYCFGTASSATSWANNRNLKLLFDN